MKKYLAVLGLVLASTAHAETSIECTDPDECSAMWTHAMQSIQDATGMRLAIATDTRIETYNALYREDTHTFHGVVSRYPEGAGYNITVSVDAPDIRGTGDL